ncbi:MAG: RsiV family protein [Desulfovibrionaceae bacterium]|nr:RsiV family protein [Desulfovibrionaceae bacterium]
MRGYFSELRLLTKPPLLVEEVSPPGGNATAAGGKSGVRGDIAATTAPAAMRKRVLGGLGGLLLMTLPLWGGPATAADVPATDGVMAAPTEPLPATREEEIRQETEHAVITVHYPVFGIPALDTDTARWAREIATAFQSDISVMEPVGQVPQKSSLEAKYVIHAPSPKAVSVTFTVWSYRAGAAHGAVDIRTRSYDMGTGTRLELTDMFGSAEKALELMAVYAHADLEKRIGEETNGEWLRNGTAPDAENFSSIALLPTGVRIFFQAYQVGPWVIGPQEVDVPLDALRDAEPRMFLWGKAEPAEVSSVRKRER